MCAQIMFALNSMKSDIQMLKTDMNVYKQKKRKVGIIYQCICMGFGYTSFSLSAKQGTL